MSEFVCLSTGKKCPIDQNLDRIGEVFQTEPGMMQFLNRIKQAIELRRANAACEGLFTDQQDFQRCGSRAVPSIQAVATRMEASLGFDSGVFKDITVTEIR